MGYLTDKLKAKEQENKPYSPYLTKELFQYAEKDCLPTLKVYEPVFAKDMYERVEKVALATEQPPETLYKFFLMYLKDLLNIRGWVVLYDSEEKVYAREHELALSSLVFVTSFSFVTKVVLGVVMAIACFFLYQSVFGVFSFSKDFVGDLLYSLAYIILPYFIYSLAVRSVEKSNYYSRKWKIFSRGFTSFLP